MKLKVFTLKMDDASGKFNDAEVQFFVEDQDHPREILDVSEHFFAHDNSLAFDIYEGRSRRATAATRSTF